MCQGQLRKKPVFYLLVVLFWLIEVNCIYYSKCLNLLNPFTFCNTDTAELHDPNNWG